MPFPPCADTKFFLLHRCLLFSQVFVVRLNEYFLEECMEVCRVYMELFVTNEGLERTESMEAKRGLTDVMKTLCVEYLNIMRKRFTGECMLLVGARM